MRRRAGSVALAAALALGPAAAGLLAGCGETGGDGHAVQVRAPAALCLGVVLPLGGRTAGGPTATVARDVLAGIHRAVPRAGTTVGGRRLRLCRVGDTSRRRRPEGVVAAAVHAAEMPRTIAVVGALDDADAQIAGAIFTPADIALLTPSGAVPPHTELAGPAGVAAAPELFSQGRSSIVRLVPSLAAQRIAAAAFARLEGCGVRGRLGRRACVVVDPADRLCTALGPSVGPERICLVPGDIAAGWATPAEAYGAAAARLAIGVLSDVAAGGGDPADRAAVLGAWARAALRVSPIGPIRLSAEASATASSYTAYTVAPSGAERRLGVFRLP